MASLYIAILHHTPTRVSNILKTYK